MKKRRSKPNYKMAKNIIIILLFSVALFVTAYVLEVPKKNKDAINDAVAKHMSIANVKIHDAINGNTVHQPKDSEKNGIITVSQNNNLLLINKNNPVDANFLPENLIQPFINGELKTEIKYNHDNTQLDKTLFDELIALNAIIQNEAMGKLQIISGFRTYKYQQSLFNDKVAQYIGSGLSQKDATKQAQMWVAPAGVSEHQSGLAVDLSFEGIEKEDFLTSKQGKWFNSVAPQYGFILRYPPAMSSQTMISHEPWHYRYVGLPHSLIMEKENLCLEGYLDYLASTMHISTKLDTGENYQIFYAKDDKQLQEIKNGIAAKYGNSNVEVSADNRGGYVLTYLEK